MLEAFPFLYSQLSKGGVQNNAYVYEHRYQHKVRILAEPQGRLAFVVGNCVYSLEIKKLLSQI